VHARRFLAAIDHEDRKRVAGRQIDLDRLMTGLYCRGSADAGAVSLMTIPWEPRVWNSTTSLIVGVG
jgi:hypothetical protein